MPMTFGTDFDTIVTIAKGKEFPVRLSYTDSCRESIFGEFYDTCRAAVGYTTFTGLSGTMDIKFISSSMHDCRVGELDRFRRVFEDLRKVYPNVTIDVSATVDPFSNRYVLQVKLSSPDVSIVPVWWWVAVLCRVLLFNHSADPGTVLDALKLPDLGRAAGSYNRSAQWDNASDKDHAIEVWTKTPKLDGLAMFNDAMGPVETAYIENEGYEW